MIKFGVMSITLLICAVQGLALAALLWRAGVNRAANRWLALLIVAVVLWMTPFIIGYAGFYDAYPWLSFAPFSYTMAFGPLIYLYARSLMGEPEERVWPHFVPVAVQFLADALVFPWPLATKNWWNTVANEPFISPFFEVSSLVSIAVYGVAAHGFYRRYGAWLAANRTDGVDLEPAWIRNFLVALGVMALVWSGFIVAKSWNPERNFFDQFGLYVGFSVLVLYLGIEGWRHAATVFPRAVEADAPRAGEVRDWAAMGREWLAAIDRERLWQDPELTLGVLARRLGTNTAYCSRALNVAAGENFNAVINRRRVAAVQGWLAAGDGRDLLTLGFDAGFSSKASFNRAFADFAGMSPSAWRLKSQK